MKKTSLLMVAMVLLLSCQKNQPGAKLNTSGDAAASLPSAVGDVVGKVTVGYQGWFSAAGDASPVNAWGHQNLEMWPDQSEYTTSYSGSPFNQGGVVQPGYTGNLGNGQPAKMFSSYDQSTVNTHFLWMQQYGIDCAALQRFANEVTPGSTIKAQRDGMAVKVKNAAQTYGRKFYIMYDASGWGNLAALQADWTNTIIGTLNLTASSAYAKQNGKPVVCVYGLGYATHPSNAADALAFINWLKAQGLYVIGSVPGQWRTGTGDAKSTFGTVWPAFDMISAWAVGRVVDPSYTTWVTGDLAYCNTNNMDYQPCAYPGTAFYNSNGNTGSKNQYKRMHGDFLWSQFAVMKNAGAVSVYVAMFDELNEATSIFKCAEDAAHIPAGKYFLTLDADGTFVSSDFYLRETGDGGKMFKGLIPYTTSHPTAHTAGGGYLDHCDATTGWSGSNPVSLNTTDKKEGTASIQSIGSGTDEFKRIFTAFNPGVTVGSGKLDFWYYVSDVTKFSAGDQIELGSGGGADVNEYSWSMGTVVNGWNHIVKTFSTAGTTGGTPNLNAINWFRIYHPKTASITTKVDAIQILP